MNIPWWHFIVPGMLVYDAAQAAYIAAEDYVSGYEGTVADSTYNVDPYTGTVYNNPVFVPGTGETGDYNSEGEYTGGSHTITDSIISIGIIALAILFITRR